MNRLEALCRYFGWQGGTIHQVAKETGCKAEDLLYATSKDESIGSDNCSGWFASRTCDLEYRLSFVEKRKGNLEFWLGVAESGKIPFYEEN